MQSPETDVNMAIRPKKIRHIILASIPVILGEKRYVNFLCLSLSTVNKVTHTAKKVISMVAQPPYSPDLSPCDFFLFLKLKFHLKDRHLGTVDNIQ
jgi:hypothetical protein